MTLTPLITAAKGFPALERLAAKAQDELILSFRILDPETRLREPALTERGLETWADLIAFLSRRGVRIRMLLADFDPLFTSDLHRKAWASASGFADVVQGDTQILCAPHGQRAGAIWKTLMRGKLRREIKRLKAEDPTRLTPIQREVLARGPVLRPATIHQKFAIADGRTCIIGGLDVDERRYDDADHDRPPEDTWHDISVEVADDDFAGALRGHFAECWNAALDCGTSSLAQRAERFDTAIKPQSRADLRLVRTFSAPCTGAVRLAPKPHVTDHEKTLIRLFSEADELVYIETQFLRHAPLVDALCTAAARAKALQLVVIMPAAPERVMFDGDHGWNARHAHGLQIRALDRLRAAFEDRLALLSPAQPRKAPEGAPRLHGAGPVYLHSKVTIVDGLHSMIGSANLNGRSMRWDSEASVLIRDGDFAKGLLADLGSYWMGDTAKERPLTQAATWRAMAETDAQRPPEGRDSYLLPFPLEPGRRFSRFLPFLPDDMF
ncbi:phospholipase D-like domain-containing protein [Tropicibacter oceani]|uniref:Phospholipase D n=1 Tax=Tropicibacter oceani TaxID=3058420 RepID=A0ABY8QNG9_9RHOB|nr:phospholipase D-like domain-containing protein [Tropicibacter oceani]WGW05367.1 phospholipase D-like domain-containing protein [Tropicibacter oceani]